MGALFRVLEARGPKESLNVLRDGQGETLLRQATDLHTKLKKMGHVNAILVLHNDVWSGRFSPTTQELMAKVQEMFKASGRNVWEHVIIGFSRCDEADRGW